MLSTGSNRQPGKPWSYGRVFALTHQQAEATIDVVSDMLTIFGQEGHILIDPGSSHSFVSKKFCWACNMELSPLACNLIVATPIRESLLAENVF